TRFHRTLADPRSEDRADGRTLRRSGRADPRENEPGTSADLVGISEDRALRDPQHSGSRLPRLPLRRLDRQPSPHGGILLNRAALSPYALHEDPGRFRPLYAQDLSASGDGSLCLNLLRRPALSGPKPPRGRPIEEAAAVEEAVGEVEEARHGPTEAATNLEDFVYPALEKTPRIGEVLGIVFQPVEGRGRDDPGEKPALAVVVVGRRLVAGRVPEYICGAPEQPRREGRIGRKREEGQAASQGFAMGRQCLQAQAHAGGDPVAHPHFLKIKC